jgi:hypothetical protein
MILLPYFIDASNPNWLKLNLFLSDGGKAFWHTGDTEKQVKKMLKDNGFPLLSLKTEQGVMYANIDRTKLNISEFYQWSELEDYVKAEDDVWRTFLIPTALWSCPVFKQEFWTFSGLPPVLTGSTVFSGSLTSLQAT